MTSFMGPGPKFFISRQLRNSKKASKRPKTEPLNTTTDPYEAVNIHFQINRPSSHDHLFSYTLKGFRRPLTKQAFIKRLALAARAAGLDPLQGHGIRIGATLHYLTLGVPMEAMKVMGQWGSDAFLRYLRKHAQILTPYIQASPEVHDAFSRFMLWTIFQACTRVRY